MISIYLCISLFLFLISSVICCYYKGYGYMPIVFSSYFLFILIIPALFHVNANIFPFYRMSYSYDNQFDAAVILLIFSIFFWVGFFLKKPKKINHEKVIVNFFSSKKINKTRFIFILYIFYILLFSYIILFGLDSFLLKRSEFVGDNFGKESAFRDLVITGFKSLSFATLFYVVVFRKHLNKLVGFISLFVGLVAFLIINFPLALPRFVIFSYIIVFICYYSNPNFKNKTLFLVSFAIGITTLFPLVSHLTRGEGDFDFNMAEYYRGSGDFDSFQSIINAVIFVEKNGYQLGNQLLSSIFSFVPRSIWVSKSEPTGSLIAESAGYDFLNISSPLPAEFFVDFGYVGLVGFSLVFGYFLRYLDQSLIFNNKQGIKYLIGIVLVSMIVILSRGPILGVLNTIYSEIFAFSFLYFLFFYKLRSK